MSDPSGYRCEKCGVPLLAPGVCDRDACRTDLDRLRAVVAAAARIVLRGARWLGLAR